MCELASIVVVAVASLISRLVALFLQFLSIFFVSGYIYNENTKTVLFKEFRINTCMLVSTGALRVLNPPGYGTPAADPRTADRNRP